jgi:acetyl esterase/lipase
MPSSEHEAIVTMLKSQPRSDTPPALEEVRAGFAAMMSTFVPEDDVRSEAVDADGVPGEWIRVPESREERVVLYFHGGGYVLGSVATHRDLISRIARSAGARSLAIDYRLAPEHAFPAAPDDCLRAYRWLLASGVAPTRLTIAGDSAGGGLVLATLLALRDAGDPLPAAAVCLSPWADLEGTGDSAQEGAVDDPLIPVEGLKGMGQLYLAGADARDPRASPLHGDYRGLPPLLIQVGTREVLLDDARRVAERARAAGVNVHLECEEGLIHVWPLFGAGVPESREAVERIGAFVAERAS